MVPKKSYKSSRRAPMVAFLIFCEVLEECVFYELLVRQKVGHQSQLAATLADKLKKCGWFGRGRRERRRAGGEKELGLRRFKSIQFRVQHVALKVAADMG